MLSVLSAYPKLLSFSPEKARRQLMSMKLVVGDEYQIALLEVARLPERIREAARASGIDDCPCCMGEGRVDCEDCWGEGRCHRCGAECWKCDGLGRLFCKACKKNGDWESGIEQMRAEELLRIIENL